MAKARKESASPKATKEKVAKSPVAKGFALEVHLNDLVIKSKGNTLLEAINKFVANKKFPLAVKTKVFLKYSHGKAKRHKLINVGAARSIFKRLRFDEDQAKFLSEKLTHELTY